MQQNDLSKVFEQVQFFRQISADLKMIKLLISSGCVKELRSICKVSNLSNKTKEIVNEALWFMVNIAAGDKMDTNEIVQMGIIDDLLDFLSISNESILNEVSFNQCSFKPRRSCASRTSLGTSTTTEIT